MQRVMRFVEERLGDSDANISEMAEATATSLSGLNRKMKIIVGLTPADFLREARIKRACQLLRNSGENVSEIATIAVFPIPNTSVNVSVTVWVCRPPTTAIRHFDVFSPPH